jgi:predicted nucleic acid-binding Zn ribbon protein
MHSVPIFCARKHELVAVPMYEAVLSRRCAIVKKQRDQSEKTASVKQFSRRILLTVRMVAFVRGDWKNAVQVALAGGTSRSAQETSHKSKELE